MVTRRSVTARCAKPSTSRFRVPARSICICVGFNEDAAVARPPLIALRQASMRPRRACRGCMTRPIVWVWLNKDFNEADPNH